MSTSLSEFSTAVEKLDEDGANWVMFKRRFMIAVGQKDVEGHFDGSEKKLVLSEGASSEVKRAFEADLKQWTKKEKLALYLLMQNSLTAFSQHTLINPLSQRCGLVSSRNSQRSPY